jgi:hypothetical protein
MPHLGGPDHKNPGGSKDQDHSQDQCHDQPGSELHWIPQNPSLFASLALEYPFLKDTPDGSEGLSVPGSTMDL